MEITGNLKYYDDTTKSLVQVWGKGNFIVLKLEADDWSIYDSVKAGLNPSMGSGLGDIKNDPDHSIVCYITNNITQEFVVETVIDGVKSTRSWTLDLLNCDKE